ncbi:MAG: glycosyl hydrolase family 8, partial [Verrucomicrobia bacterium]|nr:glycosyl hydrolase family 8 [Verrucomicrobiota bacterium]
MNWRFLAVAALSLLLAPVRAENFPFPQHVTYTAGAIKPAFSQAALDSAVTTFYNAWKAKYLVNGCASNHYYVYYSVDYTPSPANAITCSEAHGYGMLIAALMAGYDVNARTCFDGMFRFFTNHPSSITPNLMAWQQVTGCVNEPTGGNDTATDGDLDIAYALLLADRQWGSAGEINYLAEARKVIAAVMSGATGTRPSDFMPDHFRAFQLFGGNTNWARVVDKCYQIVGVIQTNNSPATGLVPDFVVNADTTPAPAPASYLEGATDRSYAYNSCRVPWRLATDYLVSGDARAKVAVDKINSWIQAKTSGNPANIKDGYNITNGAALSGTSYSLA